MRVPKDLLNDLAAHKISGRALKKRDIDALNQQNQATSSSSSSDSSRQRASGCNGLHSTTATNRLVVYELFSDIYVLIHMLKY